MSADRLPADKLPADKLIAALLAPSGLAALTPGEWYPLLTAARRGNLIGTLAARARAQDGFAGLPAAAQDALAGAQRIAEHHDGMLRWEARCVGRALADLGEPFLLLKGAAYAFLDLPSSRGRLTGDIDILVRRAALPEVEARLLAHGWETTEEDAYNQRYYRQYMHELPPLRHRDRGTVVDVHHTISPPTSRIKIDGELLLLQAQALGTTGFATLGPTDLVLHAVIHLFHEGNVGAGLRDLFDIDGLLRHFGAATGFWDELLARADALGAGRVLFYGLRYAERLLGTPVPATARRTAAARWSPVPPLLALMDRLVVEALLSYRREAPVTARAADRVLFVRSHWRRMPPALLAAHLARKLIRRGQPA